MVRANFTRAEVRQQVRASHDRGVTPHVGAAPYDQNCKHYGCWLRITMTAPNISATPAIVRITWCETSSKRVRMK